MAKGKSSIHRQLEAKFKHTRSGSYGTRARYKQSCIKFADFINKKFKMQNLRNLQDKHIVAYIKYRQAQGISPKTIKSDLGAIRYLHDMLDNAKYELSDNATLAKEYDVFLDKTPAVKGDRAWTKAEYEGMLAKLDELSQQSGSLGHTAKDMQCILPLCRTMGLRITEAVAMKRAQAEKALRTGMYEIKGEAKNGLHRSVPLSAEARAVLAVKMAETARGRLLFVREGEKVHQAVGRYEKLLERHREGVITPEGREKRCYNGKSNALTFHGLRYGYVQDRIAEEMANGLHFEQAALHVTKEIGHSRVEIVKVYMGGNV